MVEQVTGGKALPEEVVQQIASKTDGVPLFVEELTKMVVESELGTGRGKDGRNALALLPAGDSRHLAGLAHGAAGSIRTSQRVAQLGAMLGREFRYEFLQAVSSLNEEHCNRAETISGSRAGVSEWRATTDALSFQTCVGAGYSLSIVAEEHPPAVSSADCPGVGRAIPETKETQPELLAHHYTEAGLMEQAIPYWQQAGQRASKRSANLEAISHLTKGLGLLKTLPDTPERTQQELTLQLALGRALMATKGYGAPEVKQDLHPGAGAVPAARGDPPALPGAAVDCGFLFHTGGVPNRTGVGESC